MRYSHEIRQAKEAWDEIIAISESAEFEQAERIKELEERLKQALVRHSMQAEALQKCWRFFDSIYGASSGEPILYDGLPEDRQELADKAIDAISKVMHGDGESKAMDDNRYSVCPDCGRNTFIVDTCVACDGDQTSASLEADGYIAIYELETGKLVAQYEGLEIHHAIQSLSAAADLMEEARKRNEELEDRLAKSQQQVRELVGKLDHQQRLQKLERVVKTARQFTREVLENVGYDFVVEAQNMMAILDEVLGVKKAPFSPSECAHKDLQLVRYDAGPQTEKESKPEWSVTIKICPDCGQFLVQTQIHEHHLDYVFSLKQPEHVEAAGKTVEYYKHLAREMRGDHA